MHAFRDVNGIGSEHVGINGVIALLPVRPCRSKRHRNKHGAVAVAEQLVTLVHGDAQAERLARAVRLPHIARLLGELVHAQGVTNKHGAGKRVCTYRPLVDSVCLGAPLPLDCRWMSSDNLWEAFCNVTKMQ